LAKNYLADWKKAIEALIAKTDSKGNNSSLGQLPTGAGNAFLRKQIAKRTQLTDGQPRPNLSQFRLNLGFYLDQFYCYTAQFLTLQGLLLLQ
jgi:hypothetical protein